jgi:hypothetical protein
LGKSLGKNNFLGTSVLPSEPKRIVLNIHREGTYVAVDGLRNVWSNFGCSLVRQNMKSMLFFVWKYFRQKWRKILAVWTQNMYVQQF